MRTPRKRYQTRWQKEKRLRRKLSGLCINCGTNPYSETSWRCEKCRKKHCQASYRWFYSKRGRKMAA